MDDKYSNYVVYMYPKCRLEHFGGEILDDAQDEGDDLTAVNSRQVQRQRLEHVLRQNLRNADLSPHAKLTVMSMPNQGIGGVLVELQLLEHEAILAAYFAQTLY